MEKILIKKKQKKTMYIDEWKSLLDQRHELLDDEDGQTTMEDILEFNLKVKESHLPDAHKAYLWIDTDN